MLKSNPGNYQPFCELSHELINQLSIIVGNCDLLSKEALEGSEYARRLFLIREVAKDMARQLNQHQCQVEARIQAGQDQSVAKAV